MVASPRHADADRSVTAAAPDEQLPRAPGDPGWRDGVGAGRRRRSEEVARKRAAPASGVAAEDEEGRRRSVEAAALYIVAVSAAPWAINE
jgi:hypothetical protein